MSYCIPRLQFNNAGKQDSIPALQCDKRPDPARSSQGKRRQSRKTFSDGRMADSLVGSGYRKTSTPGCMKRMVIAMCLAAIDTGAHAAVWQPDAEQTQLQI
jgi:hypothetical protein